MFEFHLADVEEKYGAEYGIYLKFKALDIIRKAFVKSTNLYKFEGDLWIFKKPVDAIRAALNM